MASHRPPVPFLFGHAARLEPQSASVLKVFYVLMTTDGRNPWMGESNHGRNIAQLHLNYMRI
jgi:hypothetical protein